MNQDELAALAEALGLERALALDPAAFADAIRTARSLSARIPASQGLDDEPAHVFVPPDRPPPGTAR